MNAGWRVDLSHFHSSPEEVSEAALELMSSLELKTFQGLVERSVTPKGRLLHSGRPAVSELEESLKTHSQTQEALVIQVYFLDRSDAERFGRAIEETVELKAELAQEVTQDWNAKWKESFEGIDIGPRWKIRPPWNALKLAQDPYGIVIDPGMGFGTGSHPTTHLCLGWLSEAQGLQGTRILDFGAGSGILSIAAFKRGAASIDAVEIDEDARLSCAKNIQLNASEQAISVSEQIPKGTTYDLILGNILAHVLKDFASTLVRALKPEGRLVLSGFFQEDEEEILKTYQEASGGRLQPLERLSRESWSCLILG